MSGCGVEHDSWTNSDGQGSRLKSVLGRDGKMRFRSPGCVSVGTGNGENRSHVFLISRDGAWSIFAGVGGWPSLGDGMKQSLKNHPG